MGHKLSGFMLTSSPLPGPAIARSNDRFPLLTCRFSADVECVRLPLRAHPNLSRAEPTPPVMRGGGKARLKKISLWSKAQDKPRLHSCRPLAPGAIGQIHTHQCGWFSSFPLSGADDRIERHCGRMTTLAWFCGRRFPCSARAEV